MRLVTMWSVVFTVALQYWIVGASPQSNYAERGVDIEYQGNGIPQEATLDGIVTKLDDLTHVIRTNKSVVVVVNRLKRRAIVFNAKTLLFFSLCRSSASLSCASRAMEVDLEFAEPFYGIVYSDFDRRSACSFVGKGGTKYHYEFPLSGCGTVQVYFEHVEILFHLFKHNFSLLLFSVSISKMTGEETNGKIVVIIIIKMAFVARRDICCRTMMKASLVFRP